MTGPVSRILVELAETLHALEYLVGPLRLLTGEVGRG